MKCAYVAALGSLVLLLACRVPRLNPEAESDAAEPVVTPRPPPPPTIPDNACAAVGCGSGVHLVAHLDETPAALGARGSFRACHQTQCWEGTFIFSSAGGWRCAPSSLPVRSDCGLEAEGSGSTLSLWVSSDAAAGKGAAGFVDGDRVTLRVTVGGRRVIDQFRFVNYEYDWPDGPRCPPPCRVAAAELWEGDKGLARDR
jgi:hypothetical protein